MNRILAAGFLAAVFAHEPALAQSSSSDMHTCSLPPLAADEEVFVQKMFIGGALSSVSLVGPDEVTTLAQIEIEPGERPIYLIIDAHYPLIAVISGHTERLTKVVIASEHEGQGQGATSAAGVVGVPRDKVVVLGRGTCLALFQEPGDTLAAESVIAQTLGANPKVVESGLRIARTLLPSGTLIYGEDEEHPVPAGFDAETWKGALRFYPAGMVEVEASAVVSEGRAERYDILPSHFGLAQLVHSGALNRLRRFEFKMLKPFSHYPAVLTGTQAVRFLISRRLPEPAGNPGDSCLLWEETREPIRPSQSCEWFRAHESDL